MKQIKIRILESSVLTPRWETNFCIAALQHIFDIEYWDCTAIVSPSFSPKNEIERNYVVKITSLKDLSARLQKLPSDALLIVNIHENPENYRFYKTVSSYFKKLVAINFFTDNSQKKPVSRLSRLIRKFYPHHARKIIYWKRYRKMFVKIPIGCAPGSRPYRINHPDYEAYLKVQATEADELVEHQPYVVYVDNYFPFHPEIKKREPGFHPERSAKEFYPSLNRFFKAVEEKYHCKVLIAAHPSAIYANNPFEGRRIYFNQTNVLVKHAQGVLMHTSNSLSFVYLNNVPVAFLSNAGYRRAKGEFARLQTLARVNHIRIINTDTYLPTEDVFTPLDPQLRDEYMSYQTDGNPTPNAERLARYLQEIHEQQTQEIE